MKSAFLGLSGSKTMVNRIASARNRLLRDKVGGCERAENLLWIFDHNAIPSDMAGNARQFDHATHLKRYEWHAVIFATPFNRKTRTFNRSVSWRTPILRQLEHGVPFTWVYTLAYSGDGVLRYLNMVSYLILSTCAGLRRPGPQVVLGSSPHLLTGLAALLVAKRYRVPFVLEVRDLWPDTLIDLGLTNPLVIRPLLMLERLLYKSASHIVPVSNGIHTRIRGKGVLPSMLTLIPNAPIQAQAPRRPGRDALRARLGWSDKVVFIYSGAHGIANALDNVVAADRLLDTDSRALLVLLGDGPEKPRLMANSADLENLVFLPSVPSSEVQAYIEAANVGIVSLRASGVFEDVIPNKLIDYVIAGLPVVTTVPGESWRMIQKANAGLLAEPGNPGDLAAAIERLARDNDLRQTLANNAWIYAKTLPTRADTAKSLATVLDGVMNNQHGVIDKASANAASFVPERNT